MSDDDDVRYYRRSWESACEREQYLKEENEILIAQLKKYESIDSTQEKIKENLVWFDKYYTYPQWKQLVLILSAIRRYGAIGWLVYYNYKRNLVHNNLKEIRGEG